MLSFRGSITGQMSQKTNEKEISSDVSKHLIAIKCPFCVYNPHPKESGQRQKFLDKIPKTVSLINLLIPYGKHTCLFIRKHVG